MNEVNLMRFVHLLGVILWMGGIVAVAVAAGAAGSSAAKETSAALRRAALAVATPGMLLAWLGGLAMLVPHFTDVYARAGWMHGKLTLVLVASALSGVVSGQLRKAASGDAELDGPKLKKLGLALLFVAFAVVFLATVKPGA